jgi:cytochrome P450
LLFMAYNASIAEQFEVIQRWLSGGNSGGVSSGQSDPFLGVPRVGEPAVFRFAHGDKVVRVDLGDQAMSRLEWGLYALVPSMKALQELDHLTADPAPAPPIPAPTPSRQKPAAGETPAELRKRAKAEFEDETGRAERWKQIREKLSGVKNVGTTVMVGDYGAVMKVLSDSGAFYSASGYGERMKDTLGGSPFGQDDAGPKNGHERAFVAKVKQAIASAASEADAYETAYRFVKARLAFRLEASKRLGMPAAGIDIVDLGTELIAQLCQEWFGVAYGQNGVEVGGIDPTAKHVRCPGHFLVMARNVFSAHPNDIVQGLAKGQAPALKEAVKEWVKTASTAAAPAPVIKAVLDALDKASIGGDERNGIAANVILGLPATFLGTWLKVLRAWSVDRRLWRYQYDLKLLPPIPASKDDKLLPQMPVPHDELVQVHVVLAHADASRVLRNGIVVTMAADPVADGIWRTVQKDDEIIKGFAVEPNDVVCLSLGSALTGVSNPGQAEELLFGGPWQPGQSGAAPHACPGRELAMGALLGGLTALLLAGSWAATANPTTLALRPLAP